MTRSIHTLKNKEYWLCFIVGLSLVFSYAPFSQWYLALFIPAIVFYKVAQATPKKAATLMGVFALGWFASGISWVHVSIDQFGGMPLVVSLILMLLLSLYLALFPALAAYLTARFSVKQQLNLWLLPSFWLISEYLRSVVLTGFPWLSLGYSQIDSPLASFAPVIGEVGITALIIFINVCFVKIFITIKNGHYLKIIFPLTLVITLSLLSYFLTKATWVQTTGKTTTVALVQGNIAQSIKWEPEQEWPTMLKYLDLSRVNFDADIIIRITSDCPLIDPNLIKKMLNFYMHNNYDYLSNTIIPTFPDGLDIEIFSFSALEKASIFAKWRSEIEHVTPYIKKNPKKFKLFNYENLKNSSHIRLTIDEPVDLKLIRQIYKKLKPKLVFSLDEVLKIISSEPKLLLLNQHIKRDFGYYKSSQNDKSIR